MPTREMVPAEMMKALQEAGYRATAARRAVVDAVSGRRRPFTSADILVELRGRSGIGRATIFRTLDVLQQLGLLDRVEHADGSFGYVACPSGHHHHAICSGCGLVVDLRACGVGREAEEEALAAGFAVQGHRLEYFGLCTSCQRDDGGG